MTPIEKQIRTKWKRSARPTLKAATVAKRLNISQQLARYYLNKLAREAVSSER